MEYVFNWIVLLLSLGGIVLIAFVCYLDLVRARSSEASSQPAEVMAQTEIVTGTEQAVGPFAELHYCREGRVEHVQRVYAGQPGYVGTESYPALGAGMPVRCIEVFWRDGALSCCNLDWQTPISVTQEGVSDVDLQIGQAAALTDGAELHLPGGWVVQCRIREEQKA